MLYKVLKADGTGFHEDRGCFGNGGWSMPHDGIPGDWMPEIEIEFNNQDDPDSGYLLVNEEHLVEHLGPHIRIFEAEGRGENFDNAFHPGGMSYWSEARLMCELTPWNEEAAQHFAVDCAEHAQSEWASKAKNVYDAVYLAIRDVVKRAAKTDGEGAWGPAGLTAHAAEHAWQREQLVKYLRGETK